MEATLKDLQTEVWLRLRNQGELKWRTKEGTYVAIKDMSDSHLMNTIKMLLRKEKQKCVMSEVDPIDKYSIDPLEYYD